MINTTATLAPTDDVDAADDAVPVTMSRAEVEEVLALEELPELLLDVTRGDGEQHALSVAWTRDDVERLFETDGDITLLFKGADLERAIADDVEAHGLRKGALVLTVAVASAAAAASSAAAGGGTPDGRHLAGGPDAKRFHGIEITGRHFHGVAPDAKRFHGIKPASGRWG